MQSESVEYFKLVLAGINIEVECCYNIVFNQCLDYLAEFDKADFIVSTSIEEIKAEHAHILKQNTYKQGIAQCPAYEYSEPIVVFRKIAENMVRYNTLLMHGAVVATDKCCYMITAASGIGKTTRARLWLEEYPGSYIVNGDKPLIKVTETELIACGTPWCGKEGWNTNTMVPLRAIFFLERADEGEKTTIEEISASKAFPMLLQQTNRPSELEGERKTIQLLKQFEGKVRFYKFRSTPTREAIRLAYETVRPR